MTAVQWIETRAVGREARQGRVGILDCGATAPGS